MKCFKKMYVNDYCFVFDSGFILRRMRETEIVLIDRFGGALATAFLSNNNYKCGFDIKTTEFGKILEIEILFLFFILIKCLLYSEN